MCRPRGPGAVPDTLLAAAVRRGRRLSRHCPAAARHGRVEPHSCQDKAAREQNPPPPP